MIFLIPALLDTLGSFCCFLGLALLAASTFQILKMLCMVFVVLLSVLILRRKFTWVQYLAVAVVIGGLALVSLDSILGADDKKKAVSGASERHLIIVGVIAMITGQLFHAAQAIYEEYIL